MIQVDSIIPYLNFLPGKTLIIVTVSINTKYECQWIYLARV